MTLHTGADVGPYVVLGPARREARHARDDGPRQPPRVWRGEPFGGGDPVALLSTGVDARTDDPAESAARDAAGALLRREWALTGSVRHPHLVGALDLLEGEALRPPTLGHPDDDQPAVDPGPVLVTAWAEGGSLAAMLRTDTLSPGQTVTVLAAVCAGLAACHERGLVHGDVQPDTVVVTADGRPQLIRCGRATAAADLGVAFGAEPRCASPDVARGRAATVMDDVFSLGAVAMQCLTGRPAWPARDLRDVVVQSEFGQWPTVADAAAGPVLTALVDAMLAADAAARPTLREVLARLADCPDPEPLPAVTAPAEGADGGRHARPEPVTPEPPPFPAPSPAAEGRHRREPGLGPASGWSRVLVPAVVLAVVVAAAVAAGVWWADRDRPAAAMLPAEASAAGSAPVPAATPAVDWSAVIDGLDARRAAAFAAADPALLREVWAVTAPGLVEDDTRIRSLQAQGLRVEGLRHEITAVQRLDDGAADPTAMPVLAVTEALPSATVRDGAGEAVGSTAAVDGVRRVLTLEPAADGFRIASVTAGAG